MSSKEYRDTFLEVGPKDELLGGGGRGRKRKASVQMDEKHDPP